MSRPETFRMTLVYQERNKILTSGKRRYIGLLQSISRSLTINLSKALVTCDNIAAAT